VAVEKDLVDILFQEAYEVKKIFEEHMGLRKMMDNPNLQSLEKEEIVKNIFKDRVQEEMVGFLVLLVNKGRQKYIIKTLKYFIDEVKEYKHIGVAYITSANELTQKQKDALEAKLLETTNYESFEIKYFVDKSLLGGLYIRIGDRVVDSTLKTKLEQMSKELAKIHLS
jgi:F-type H+-transporting ATPase subunit delta